jgi:hypothetical protein
MCFPSMTREQLDTIADQIVDLSLRINLAKHAPLTNIRIFDDHEGAEELNFSDQGTCKSGRVASRRNTVFMFSTRWPTGDRR